MIQQKSFLLVALTLFVAASFIEGIWMQRKRLRYPWKNLAATIGVGTGQRLSGLLYASATLALFTTAEQWQVFQFSMQRPVHWIALFLIFEFAYYWFHRASHRINWVWATHRVHHSSNEFYLPSAVRLGWTSFFSLAWMFWLPLVFLGFPAKAVLAVLSVNLLYQFILHTKVVPKLGVIEYLFNTPSHHRAHHGSNDEYLDCNYGGVIILYDRIFGTFVEEMDEVPVKYGLTTPETSHNPFVIALAGWRELFVAMSRGGSLRNAVRVALDPPGPPRLAGVRPASIQWSMCAALVVPALALSYLTEIYQRGWFLLPDVLGLAA